MRMLGDVARGTETILQDWLVILRIRRLQRSFRGAHGGSGPPPSPRCPYVYYLPITH